MLARIASHVASAQPVVQPAASDAPKPPRVAVVCTSYFPGSHADVVVSKFVHGFPTDEGLLAPRMQVVSMYIDQIHADDIGLQVAAEHGIAVFSSIRDALTLSGQRERSGRSVGGEHAEDMPPGAALGVDAVLLIGEHGDYPKTELGQEMTPRRYFCEQIFAVLVEAGRTDVPVYNDKHLAYRWAVRKGFLQLWAINDNMDRFTKTRWR